MKKMAKLILVVMTIVLCACDKEDKSNSNASTILEQMETSETTENKRVIVSASEETDDDIKSDATITEDNTLSVQNTPNGNNIMPLDEFMNYVTKVELTTENWKDYLEIGLQRIEEKDAFGDVVRIDEYYVWQLKDEIAAQNSKSVAFKIEDKKSDCKATMEAWFEKQFGTSGIWHDSPSERVYTIDDFECIKAKGIIYLIMVPNDRWIDYSNDLNGMYSDEETKDTLQSLNPEKIIYVGTSSQYIIVTNKGFMTDGHNFICFEPNAFNFRISLEEYFKESRGLNHG